MKLFLLFTMLVSVGAAIASAEHFHSFALGLTIALLAVGSCYWFAFYSSKTPRLALVFLICGMLSKLAVTVMGVIWSISADLISSPMIFALSYLFFSLAATFLWFTYRERLTAKEFKPLLTENSETAIM